MSRFCYSIPHMPRLGQQPAEGQPAGMLPDCLEPPVTAANVEKRIATRVWPQDGQPTLAESATLATRFSNSAPHSSQRYS